MNEFAQQGAQLPQPFAMEQMRQDPPSIQNLQRRTPSPGWAADFDPGEQVRMEAAFAPPKLGAPLPSAFSTADYQRFQTSSPTVRAASPMSQVQPAMNTMYRPMGMNNYSGMGMNSMYSHNMYAQPAQQQDKGKSRMVELDEQNWEQQFAELDKQDNVSEEAREAMERELNDLDRSVSQHAGPETQFQPDHYTAQMDHVWNRLEMNLTRDQNRQLDGSMEDTQFTPEDYAAWDNFDANMGLNAHNPFINEPFLGSYMFEQSNPFMQDSHANGAFEKGMQILRDHGNLSLAALAFEAAVQQDPNHVEAWLQLGNAQAQNEKETAAIRALERALQLDPNNLDALMSLAVSYTNEGYDSTAYRTLERWLSVKYPSICPPNALSDPSDIGFSDQVVLHDRVTNLFIKAAQLSPSGSTMDPDVQVGLGVLFYGAEDFEKAIDCFNAALASHETGTSNRENQIHLLWNRLGATLANSGKSEDAIAAYSRALEENPNFVRARYNLGVSCINIGCYPEAAAHLLGALSLHRQAGQLEQAKEVLVDGNGNPLGDIDDIALEHIIQQNESGNIYDTLRRAFSSMGRRDLTEKVGVGMNLEEFRSEFDF